MADEEVQTPADVTATTEVEHTAPTRPKKSSALKEGGRRASGYETENARTERSGKVGKDRSDRGAGRRRFDLERCSQDCWRFRSDLLPVEKGGFPVCAY